MELTPRQQQALADLLQRVNVGERPRGGPYRARTEWRRRDKPSYWVEGEGLDAFWAAVRELARPALAGDGLSEEEAERIVASALASYVDDGEAAAIAAVERALGEPERTWTVIKRWSGVEPQPDRELNVGACTIARGVPRDVEGAITEEWAQDTTIRVQVMARDPQAATVLANQAYEEAIAVLQVADPTAELQYRSDALVVGEAVIHGLHPGPGGLGLVMGMFDEAGRLITPPFAELSAAAATPGDQRSEWQRRCVTAARWHSQAVSSKWPTDALVSAIVAIEALLGEPGVKRGKAQRLAQRAANVLDGIAGHQRSFRKWLQALYEKARNPVVHAGIEHTDEIEVKRLVDIAGCLVEIAAHHLQPAHRSSGACTSLTQVLSCDGGPTAIRRRRSRPGRPVPR